MSQLSSYPNVYNTCLVWLDRDGFELSYDKVREMWCAKNDSISLQADNPIELLGLAAIWQKTRPKSEGEYWWQISEPNFLSKLDPE